MFELPSLTFSLAAFDCAVTTRGAKHVGVVAKAKSATAISQAAATTLPGVATSCRQVGQRHAVAGLLRRNAGLLHEARIARHLIARCVRAESRLTEVERAGAEQLRGEALALHLRHPDLFALRWEARRGGKVGV